MIIEKLDGELEETTFVNPVLPGNKFLSITFTEEDRTEFLKSQWSKVTQFEDAARKYLGMIV